MQPGLPLTRPRPKARQKTPEIAERSAMDQWVRDHPDATAGEAAAHFGLSDANAWFQLRARRPTAR